MRVLLHIRKLPGDQVLVSFVAVGPAVPSEGARVHNMGDPVQEVSEVCLQNFGVVDELVDLADHENRIDFLPRDHDLKVAVTRGDLLSDRDSSQLAK